MHRYGRELTTQQAVIIDLLAENVGQWVSLPQLLKTGVAQYAARVWELRHRHGFEIENRTHIVGRQRHSFYRLKGGLTQWQSSAQAAAHD